MEGTEQVATAAFRPSRGCSFRCGCAGRHPHGGGFSPGAGFAVARRYTAINGSHDGRQHDTKLIGPTNDPDEKGSDLPDLRRQPARSTDPSLQSAGAITGLNLLRIITEPTTAAIA